MWSCCVVVWEMVGNVFYVVGVFYDIVCVIIGCDGCNVVVWWKIVFGFSDCDFWWLWVVGFFVMFGIGGGVVLLWCCGMCVGDCVGKFWWIV